MNILIIGPSWVGDSVMAQSLYIQLKKEVPDCNIDVVSPPWTVSIMERMPQVSRKIVSPFLHGDIKLISRNRFGKSLKKFNYDRSIILTNSFKSALVPYFAKIPIRTGWLGEFRYGLINRIIKSVDREEGMVNRYLNLLGSQYNESLIPRINHNIDKKIVNKTYSLDKEYIVFCPDAEYGPAKRWPINKWVELANKINNQYQIIFIGLDQSIDSSLKSIKTDYINLINKTSLNDILSILSNASCVIANDSGLMHLAAALDKPIVGIFGSSSPIYTPPLTHDKKRSIIYKNLNCSPCFKRQCPLEHLNCLNDIHVDHVRDEVFKLIN